MSFLGESIRVSSRLRLDGERFIPREGASDIGGKMVTEASDSSVADSEISEVEDSEADVVSEVDLFSDFSDTLLKYK
jgi:hypothetical protein